MRNSRITQRDSYSLKALSLVATVFLPISTVATVFSTPFFEASGPSTSPQASAVQGGGTLLVHGKFWLLMGGLNAYQCSPHFRLVVLGKGS